MMTLGERIEWGSDTTLMYEAAAQIEQLEAEKEKLRALHRIELELCKHHNTTILQERHVLQQALFNERKKSRR